MSGGAGCDTASGTRKRSIEESSESEEIPIAKRIRHLTLDPSQGLIQTQTHNDLPPQYNGAANNHNTAYGQSSAEVVTQYHQQGGDNSVGLIKYDPELDKNLNPHYYEINRLLFDAHMQRLQREMEK